ncbi:copper resistance CopC family protein [Amycolatopsis suaedae]|uniref:Copper resistance protein CopC n=1 Tax=Amycolatopsis suaedae TaxID=2510978 RepID=A0A4Q7IYQ3_9PSEU|nr:copper resistance CopC family protein [Amycolatopsis suaedae]RZQ59589.1 copper resistance protein CopC [Amycolatopsis suaedae]
MRRIVAALALGFLALPALAGTAAAHTTLAGSDPAEGAALDKAPTQLKLKFSGQVQSGGASITVTGPDGSAWQVGELGFAGTEVIAPVTPSGPAGLYQAKYVVTAADGHEVDGIIRFTLTVPAAAPVPAPASAPATPPPPPSPAPAAQAPATDTGSPAWPWIVGGVALVVVAVVVALRLLRRRG